MTWTAIAGDWGRFNAAAKLQWSKLTGAQLEVIAGNRMALVGKVCAVYGISRGQAEKQVDSWARRVTAEAATP